MPAFLDNLELRALLRITAAPLKRAEARSSRFRQLFREDTFVFQIASDAGTGGHFILANGGIRYHSGIHPAPELSTLKSPSMCRECALQDANLSLP